MKKDKPAACNVVGPSVTQAIKGQCNLRIVGMIEGRLEIFIQTGSTGATAEQDAKNLERMKRELANARELEPGTNWRLQTRGQQADWHDFKE